VEGFHYMRGTFIDLDELILLCKDKTSRRFIQEAAACYKAGAYRSCIIATWNAVVFDFIDKLRKLAQMGNGQAQDLLNEFKEMSQNSKVKELWQFESNIPLVALRDFELISPIEREDIERLFKDRSRCAHPSMASIDEPFEATAELARYHLRSAVTHLLQRPPAQGNAAIQKIWKEISSSNFPTNYLEAIEVFRNGALARARKSLLKDFVVGLTKDLLTTKRPKGERDRQYSAFIAVFNMYRPEVSDILTDRLNDIIRDRVEDEYWANVIEFICRTDTSEFINSGCTILAKTFIQNFQVELPLISEQAEVLEHASRVFFLRDLVKQKIAEFPLEAALSFRNLKGLTDEIQTHVVNSTQDRVDSLLLEILECFKPNLPSGGHLGPKTTDSIEKILRISDFFSEKNKTDIIEAYCDSDFRNHPKSDDVILEILKLDCEKYAYLPNYWFYFKENIKTFSGDRFEKLYEIVENRTNDEF
jgi:hypothetical protein